MRTFLVAATLWIFAHGAHASDWVDVGADPETKYFVDVDSIHTVGENVVFAKRGIYSRVLTDNFGGHPTTFKEARGNIELDCARRVNRVTLIELLSENGDVVWTSGPLAKRMWEDVKPNTHAETTMVFVCARINQ
ncbi:MAG: surface-adhesin E family protein [Burkholderiales bacterium]